MFLSTLALASLLAGASSDSAQASMLPEDAVLDPADTLPAVPLTEAPYYVRDHSGENRTFLDSCFCTMRETLVQAIKQNRTGEFAYEQMVKYFPGLGHFPAFRPAIFRVSINTVYAYYPQNEGFMPTIGLENNKADGHMTFFYVTQKGESQAWALLVETQS